VAGGGQAMRHKQTSLFSRNTFDLFFFRLLLLLLGKTTKEQNLLNHQICNGIPILNDVE
jgi:hypothetical protein